MLVIFHFLKNYHKICLVRMNLRISNAKHTPECNPPYEEIFQGYYSDKTHIDCQYKFGEMIKNHYKSMKNNKL